MSKPKQLLTACPHCGGTDGVKFTSWQKFRCVRPFKGDSEVAEYDGEDKQPKYGECMDCGGKIEIKRIAQCVEASQ